MLLFFMYSSGLMGQVGSSCLRVMFYNVENAFDNYDDTVNDDNEFLPDGVRRWNKSRYDSKIRAIYKTIIAAGEWSPPEIIGFCEIENRKVVEDIIGRTYLSKYPYGIIHEDSPDPRGIDVCLIYRKDCVNLISYRYWKPVTPDFDSRTVLYSKIVYRADTLNLIFNHWPSRRGGVLAGMDLRTQIASMVREKADSIIRNSLAGNFLIIAGDFNSNPEDPEMAIFKSGGKNQEYVNLSAKAVPFPGTYRYQGRWEMFDQVIVSSNLTNEYHGGSSLNALLRIVSPDFLLMDDPVYPGKSPFATYRGFRYQGGFSDHLPVIVTLQPD